MNPNISEKLNNLLPSDRLEKHRSTFIQLDKNQDGYIDIGEFLEHYLTTKKVQLTRKFEELDTNKDGTISFDEFLIAAEPTLNILKRFQELDTDQNGLLSQEEALKIADELVLSLSSEQVKKIIQSADQDKDGQITYYEYLGAITHLGFQ